MSELFSPGLVPSVFNPDISNLDCSALQEHAACAQRTRRVPERASSHEVQNEPHIVIRGETSENNRTAHIDWFAFTFTPSPDVTNDPVTWLLPELFEVFGLPEIRGISTGKGWNGYTKCVDLGDHKQYGLIALGGEKQRGTVHVELNAAACAHVPNWLFVQLWSETLKLRITRIDLAHDDFEGEAVNIKAALTWYDAGAFTSNGRPPAAKLIDDLGTDKGKTLYIGNRANGKLLRVYEKGKQLGDPKSTWVRVELELRGQNRAIPLGVLTSPSKYLAGGYPCLAYLSAEQEKIRTVNKTVQVSLEAGRKYLRTAGGKWLNVLMQAYGGDACAVISVLVRPGVPRRLENYGDFLPEVFGGGHAVDPQ